VILGLRKDDSRQFCFGEIRKDGTRVPLAAHKLPMKKPRHEGGRYSSGERATHAGVRRNLVPSDIRCRISSTRN
jgi:hypothetical protein